VKNRRTRIPSSISRTISRPTLFLRSSRIDRLQLLNTYFNARKRHVLSSGLIRVLVLRASYASTAGEFLSNIINVYNRVYNDENVHVRIKRDLFDKYYAPPGHIIIIIIMCNCFDFCHAGWAWWAISGHWPRRRRVGARSCCTRAWASPAPRPTRWTSTGTPRGLSRCRPPSVRPVSALRTPPFSFLFDARRNARAPVAGG